MINKLLIANRGEIACRIIRTAQKLGIRTVAVYSAADHNALHVSMADEAAFIGEAPSKQSYLCAQKIIDVAKHLNVDAIHPGYGFLSENAAFAEACLSNGIIFVGPPASAIRAMGSKSAAKGIMETAGVPLVPGYHGDDQSEAVLRRAAQEMGYPVLLKAAAGGGGKGMRQVWDDDGFSDALQAAKREAMASFGDDAMLVEKYLTRPRHVEFQVFCDQQGNGVYLFERDCSLQRRHQKVIEEAPAPGMTDALRQQMGEAALQAAQAINYEGAGTVEFLLDEDHRFYFMEMNTRLQVEHPVTEMITGEDLVAWQLMVAEGKPLPKTQQALSINGHAFEARIYAEDPDNDFLPATGKLALLQQPAPSNWVRVDTGVRQGDSVSVFYDPMIAKLVVWGENRTQALRRLGSALRDYKIAGVVTNTDYLHRLATHPAFINAELTTTFIDQHKASLQRESSVNMQTLAIMALATVIPAHKNAAGSPWQIPSGWRMNSRLSQSVSLRVGTQEAVSLEVTWPTLSHKTWTVSVGDTHYEIAGKWQDHRLELDIDGIKQSVTLCHHENTWTLFTLTGAVLYEVVNPDLGDESDNLAHNQFTAPMNGTIVTCPVSPGNNVKKGGVLVVMEAMKMEHSIKAPCDGMLVELYCKAGDLVDGGSVLLEFSPHES